MERGDTLQDEDGTSWRVSDIRGHFIMRGGPPPSAVMVEDTRSVMSETWTLVLERVPWTDEDLERLAATDAGDCVHDPMLGLNTNDCVRCNARRERRRRALDAGRPVG